MHSLASCCTHKGASDACTPYQRLHRSTPVASCLDNDKVDAGSNRFICHTNTASSSSNRFAVSAINNVDSQLINPSDCNAASSSPHLRNGIKAHCNAGSQSKRLDCNEAGGACHRSDDCTSLTISTPTEINAEEGMVSLDDDADTVLVKIGILGDTETGKTSFMAKYGGKQVKHESKEWKGVTLLQKVCKLHHVNIALHIWDLGGQWPCANKLVKVCKDADAIFIMFDLTRRSTLHSVKNWVLRAQECNKVALFVVIGTKYDDFVQIPLYMQLAIIQEARFYSQAIGAPLFFSSVTHNINIHKIFKVVVAKLFDLPCTISQNLNLGEPIVEYFK